MQTRNLAEKLSVSSQLTPPDLTAAAHQGIRSIINNRPDAEASDQPTSAEIEAAAAALGLGYRHIPVVPGQIDDKDIANFSVALAALEAPSSPSAALGPVRRACGRSPRQQRLRRPISCRRRAPRAMTSMR
jgi:uncharacterized protein (TIGR01244 family)